MCVSIGALTSLAAPAQAAKKPDLVIAGATLQGQRYAFKGEPGGFFTRDTTRNVGKAAAGRSSTRAYLIPAVTGQTIQPLLGSRAVVRLGPGQQSAGDNQNSTSSYNYPIGPYWLKVCADAARQVPESNESNNCVLVRNPVLEAIKVYIVRKVWYGVLDGGGHLGNLVETYKSNNARLVFNRAINAENGVFAYNFAGPVTYTASGGGSGCTYSGEGTQSIADSEAFAFDYLRRRYWGGASINGTFYSINVRCGTISYQTPGPVIPGFLSTGPSRSFPFGANRVSGSYSSTAQTWSWAFGASAGGGD